MLLLVLGAVAVIVGIRWVADRTGLPAAALLTLAGIGYALLPGPNVSLDPHLVLTLVLPPLLYSAALDSSLTAIRRNLRTVVSLSVLLVLVTAVLIGIGFELFVTGATLAARILLGGRGPPPYPGPAGCRGRPAGPGVRAAGRAEGGPAAAVDHPHPGRGAAQRRHRADPAHRRGQRGAGRRVLPPDGGRAVRDRRRRRSGRRAGRRLRGAAAAPAAPRPAVVERDLAGHAVRGLPAR